MAPQSRGIPLTPLFTLTRELTCCAGRAACGLKAGPVGKFKGRSRAEPAAARQKRDRTRVENEGSARSGKARARFRARLALALGLAMAVPLSALISQAQAQTFRSEKAAVTRATLALMEEKGMDRDAPILVRIYKSEAELEIWKETRQGTFALLKTYPICRWSGDLGPKIREGDRQAPEGFYRIGPAQMNPNSEYFLSFNLGYPNAFDRAHGRTGSALMVHGDCLSRGCYAMTNEQMAEVYGLAQEALLAGQTGFQAQVFPFRMTPENLALHRNNPNMPFWRMLKEGADHFEVTKRDVKVDVCERRYVFNAMPPGTAGGGGQSTGGSSRIQQGFDPWAGVNAAPQRAPATASRPVATQGTTTSVPATTAPPAAPTPSVVRTAPATAAVAPAAVTPAAPTVSPVQPPSMAPRPAPPVELVFEATGKCPDFEVPATIRSAVAARQAADNRRIASLSGMMARAAPARLGRDGGMHPVFLAQLVPEGTTDDNGRIIPRPRAPGTVPNYVNPPIDPSLIVAELGLAGEAPKPFTGPVPVPRRDPRGYGARTAVAGGVSAPAGSTPAGSSPAAATRTAARETGARETGAAEATTAATSPGGTTTLPGTEFFTRMMAPVASWMGAGPRASEPEAATAPAFTGPVPTPRPRPAAPRG
jgi:murein L,D-transpeptidase YafK